MAKSGETGCKTVVILSLDFFFPACRLLDPESSTRNDKNRGAQQENELASLA